MKTFNEFARFWDLENEENRKWWKERGSPSQTGKEQWPGANFQNHIFLRRNSKKNHTFLQNSFKNHTSLHKNLKNIILSFAKILKNKTFLHKISLKIILSSTEIPQKNWRRNWNNIGLVGLKPAYYNWSNNCRLMLQNQRK